MAKPLEPELEAGLRRLKLRRVRELAPELLQTARTQRWPPEDLLTVLVREEIAARERSNLANRLRAAQFPGHKTLDAFDPAASELSRTTFEFLRSLEWLERNDNIVFAGPAGTGKSHLGEALGRAACEAGHRVRFFSADDLVEALYRGLADNSVGKLIAGLLRNDVMIIDVLGFTAMDRVAAEDLFRFVTAACEKRSLIVSTNVEFERWTRFLPDENRRHRDSRPAPAPLPRHPARRRIVPATRSQTGPHPHLNRAETSRNGRPRCRGTHAIDPGRRQAPRQHEPGRPRLIGRTHRPRQPGRERGHLLAAPRQPLHSQLTRVAIQRRRARTLTRGPRSPRPGYGVQSGVQTEHNRAQLRVTQTALER